MQKKIIRLRQGRQGVLKPKHPWIYKRQFLKPEFGTGAADIVSVLDSAGKFIGTGYYNPKSEISVRILSFDKEPIDEAFFISRIKAAVEKRRPLLDRTNAYRAVFSEADGLPGLITDVYNDTAVFQVLTLGMERFKAVIVEALRGELKPKYIYEKSASPFRKIEGLKDAKGWRGEEGSFVVEIFEGKAKFLVDIEKGHKTGFYLDQRRSRMALESICKDRKVLDLFCYTGAFGITAAIYGAKEVRGFDIGRDCIELAAKNAALNNVEKITEFIKKDVFSALEEICAGNEKFDIIILDPPSFLKTRQSIVSASKGYKELNIMAMKALSEAGILATFSCSHNMPNEIFSNILKEAAIDAEKKISILKRCHQAEDHPIVRAIPETEYLKGYFLKVSAK